MKKLKRLTVNEKRVLEILIDNSRTSDSSIAEKMALSVSSVSRIRERLLSKGIIKKYTVHLDYEKLGINCLVLVFYSATSKWWKDISNDKVLKIASSPYIISLFKASERNISYIVLYGFQDNKSATTYFDEVQRVYNEYLIIEKLIFLSQHNILKDDCSGLLKILSVNPEGTKPNRELFNKLINRKNKI